MKNNLNKKSSGIIILIALIMAAILLNQAHYLSFYYFGSTGVPTNLPGENGATLLGVSQLSNISIINNQYGHSGPWWIATAVFGSGPDQLNVQSIASPNSSYICSNSCKTKTLGITVLKNIQEYQISSAGQQVSSYQASILTSNKQPGAGAVQLQYQGCTNALPGTMQNLINYSTQLVQFNCIATTSTINEESYQNYINACQGQGGFALIYQYGQISTSRYTNEIQLNLNGLPIQFYTGTTMGCYELEKSPYAYIYSVGQPHGNTTLALSLNGNTITVNNRNNPTNVSNPTMQLQWVGYLQESAAPQQNVSVIQYYNIESGTPAQLVKASAYTLDSEYSSSQAGLLNTKWITFSDFNNSVSQFDNKTKYLFVNSTFGNITYQPGTRVPIELQLNDMQFNYYKPVGQMVIEAQALGLAEIAPSFQIKSFTLQNASGVRSGGQEYAYVEVLNNGTVPGAVNTRLISPSGLIIVGNSQQRIITPNNITTFTFTLTGTGNLYVNYPNQSLMAQVCSTYSSTCENLTRYTSLLAAVNGNSCQGGTFNPSTGQCIGPAPAPLTSTICQQNCKNTTTLIATTTASPNCNQGYTYMNGQQGAGCYPNAQQQIPFEYLIIAIIAIVVIILLFSKTKIRGGGGSINSIMKRPVGRPPKSSYSIG